MPPFLPPPDDFIESDDFVSLELADGDVLLLEPPLVAPLPEGDGELVPLFMSLDDDGELPLLLPPPALELPDPCASAGAAVNARAATSANAPVNVFIAVPPAPVRCLWSCRRRPQLAWRRSATGLRKSCSVGGVSMRAILGSVTGRPS